MAKWMPSHQKIKTFLREKKKISNRGRSNLANASFLGIRPYLCNICQRVLEFLFSRFKDWGLWRWDKNELFNVVLHDCCLVRTRPAISKQRTCISPRPTPFLKSTNHLIWLTAPLAFCLDEHVTVSLVCDWLWAFQSWRQVATEMRRQVLENCWKKSTPHGEVNRDLTHDLKVAVTIRFTQSTNFTHLIQFNSCVIGAREAKVDFRLVRDSHQQHFLSILRE